MPLVKIQLSPGSRPRSAFAQSDGSITLYPYHLYDCYDWELENPTPDEIRRIPPESWMGQILYSTRNIDPSTSMIATAAAALAANTLKANALADAKAPATAKAVAAMVKSREKDDNESDSDSESELEDTSPDSPIPTEPDITTQL